MIELLLVAERLRAGGDLTRAENLFSQVVEADPRNAIALVGLARVAHARGDSVHTMALVEQALTIDPDESAAQRLLTELQSAARRPGATGAGLAQPRDTQPHDVPPVEPGPEVVEPEGVAPEGVAPDVVEPEGLAPEAALRFEGVLPDVVAPEGLAPEGLAPEGLAPEAVRHVVAGPASRQGSLVRRILSFLGFTRHSR